MDIKKKANALVRKYNTRNPFEIAKHLNLILVIIPLSGNTRGFYQYFQRNNIIYIDESLPESEQALVLAHELGHMLLHRKTNALFLDTRTHLKTYCYEKEANTFAAELLIPDSLILEHPGYTKSQLARLAGYDEMIMEFKKID